MKRFHVHIAVDNFQDNIRFYSALFGVDPAITKTDYAKWMLDDPFINFAISARGTKSGLDHVGIQVDSNEALNEMNQRIAQAELPATEQKVHSAVMPHRINIGRLIRKVSRGKYFIR